MRTCAQCGKQFGDDANFCSGCGALLPGATPPPPKPITWRKKPARWLILLPLNIGITVSAFYFIGVKGCSSVEGSLVSKGKPAGDFVFTPGRCRSGERMQFYGAVILGESRDDGAVVAIIDPVKGELVKIEVPGSCLPPDYEKCTEVIVDRKHCSRYEVAVTRTGTQVNRITLLEGRIDLDCAFPDGGSIHGGLQFERCD